MKSEVFAFDSTFDYGNLRNKKHSFDKFERTVFDERWSKRYYYILFSILLSNSNDVNLHMVKLQVALSGGLFIILLTVASFLIVMPLNYVEIFFGKYTRLTNSQIYRIATLFFGFSLTIFLLNIVYQVISIPNNTVAFINAVKTCLNFNLTEKCQNNSECYSYIVEGPLNDNCTNNFPGMQCESRGLIFYRRLFLYWDSYLRAGNNETHIFSQLIAGLALTWVLILYISLKKLDVLGSIMFVSFMVQFIILAIILSGCMFFYHAPISYQTLFKIDFKVIRGHTILNAVWYIVGHIILIPSGYMSIYAYAYFSTNFGFECFLITLFNLFLRMFYFLTYYAAAGVVAKHFEVEIENVISPEGGLFFIVIPEFFDHLGISSFFVAVYYISTWLWNTIKYAVCLHLLLLSWYDYFPKTKSFSTYVTVIACIVLCLLSISACLKKFNMYVTPFMLSVCLRIYAELWVAVMSTMVSCFYGVSRLCEDIKFTTGQKPVKYWRTVWNILPVFSWVSVFLSEKDVIPFSRSSSLLSEIKHKNTYTLLSYFVFLTIVFISTVFKIVSSLTVPHLFLKLIKPQFYWGPPSRDQRIQRKLYNPSKQIRSENVYTPQVEEKYPLTLLVQETIDEYLS